MRCFDLRITPYIKQSAKRENEISSSFGHKKEPLDLKSTYKAKEEKKIIEANAVKIGCLI